MKISLGTLLLLWLGAASAGGQVSTTKALSSPNSSAPAPMVTNVPDYTVSGATPAQEAVLRAQISQMHPGILPLRVIFVPHWKYLDNARIFHLHVPTGYASAMFTHLPSRTVFIDNDRYLGEDWLGHWIAHELGHLATSSAKEADAEKAAREFRRRLKDTRKQDPV